MSFTSIELNDTAGSGEDVVVQRGSGSPFTVDYQQSLPCSVGCWGLTAAGAAYFDTTAADPGDVAALGYDPNVRLLTLTSGWPAPPHGGGGGGPGAVFDAAAVQQARFQAREPSAVAAFDAAAVQQARFLARAASVARARSLRNVAVDQALVTGSYPPSHYDAYRREIRT